MDRILDGFTGCDGGQCVPTEREHTFEINDEVVIRSDALAGELKGEAAYQEHRLHIGKVIELPKYGGVYYEVEFKDEDRLLMKPSEIALYENNEPKGFDEGTRKVLEDAAWTALKGGAKLRELFPHGHPEFTEILTELAELHSNKNFDYARGGNPLGNFNRCAAVLETTPAKFAWSLVAKQIDAVNWAFLQGGDQKCESVRDKLRDIAVYSILIMIMLGEESKP